MCVDVMLLVFALDRDISFIEGSDAYIAAYISVFITG